MIRVCPKRDAKCPHGTDCPYSIDRYHCAQEPKEPASSKPAADGDGVVERLRERANALGLPDADLLHEGASRITALEHEAAGSATANAALTARLAEATAAREEVERERDEKIARALNQADVEAERAGNALNDLEAAEQALAEMREALKPFAEVAGDFDGEESGLSVGLVGDERKPAPEVLVSDFRRARTLLQRTP